MSEHGEFIRGMWRERYAQHVPEWHRGNYGRDMGEHEFSAIANRQALARAIADLDEELPEVEEGN